MQVFWQIKQIVYIYILTLQKQLFPSMYLNISPVAAQTLINLNFLALFSSKDLPFKFTQIVFLLLEW